ncbi:MAG: nucleoside 2-deoxyribosyltransferase [Anaerolineae bacterium]|nr:nucleoside 2-deoxyribosyltransferase [Anaerolineae bacterium]
MAYIYVAGPLFNTHERWYLEQISAALEQAGHRTFLPHRDAGIFKSEADRPHLFHTDMQALEACDMLVALLTGADHDSGTCAELGYVYARGKACFGITDDVRRLNNLIWGLCGEGSRIVQNIDDLMKLVNTL